MRYTIFVSFIIITCSVCAQEGQFSQYFASSTLLNPAFTGTIPALALNSNFKRGGNPSSDSYIELMQSTFTFPFKRTTSKDQQIGGAGVSFFREKRGFQGVYVSQKILLTGAYSLKLSQFRNQYFIFGLQGGVVQHKIDGNRLTWGSQFNRYIGFDNTLPPEALNGSEPIFYPTFNFGIIYTAFDNENMYIRDKSITFGLSADNLNRPTFTFTNTEEEPERKSILVKAFVTSKITFAPRWSIHPSGYVMYSQGSTQINGGVYFSTLLSSAKAKTAFLMQIGSWYRVGDSIISMLGFQMDNLRLGFSTDLNTQTFNLTEDSKGDLPTYEISLTYNLNLTGHSRNISSPIF